MKIFALSFAIPLFALNAAMASEDVISWSSPAGVSRLEESRYKGDFFKLANQFESQQNKVFCGVASTTIVLNALRMGKNLPNLPLDEGILAPKDRIYFTQKNFTPIYARYTQNTVMANSPKLRLSVLGKPRQPGGLPEYGYNLQELTQLLKSHGVNTRTVYMSSAEKHMKHQLINALSTPEHYVIINYSREIIGQGAGGHISPLAAYHQPSDSFLIMDVAPAREAWVWVPSEILLKAMATADVASYRGYVIVSDAASGQQQSD